MIPAFTSNSLASVLLSSPPPFSARYITACSIFISKSDSRSTATAGFFILCSIRREYMSSTVRIAARRLSCLSSICFLRSFLYSSSAISAFRVSRLNSFISQPLSRLLCGTIESPNGGPRGSRTLHRRVLSPRCPTVGPLSVASSEGLGGNRTLAGLPASLIIRPEGFCVKQTGRFLSCLLQDISTRPS